MIWSDRDYGLTHSGLPGSSDPPGWYSQERGLGARIRRHSSEERGHAPQKFGQGGTPMIARHVGMQFPPQTLDAIVIGRVRGQKMQDDAPVELLSQRPLHQAAGMNPVVVEDHVEFGRG